MDNDLLIERISTAEAKIFILSKCIRQLISNYGINVEKINQYLEDMENLEQ